MGNDSDPAHLLFPNDVPNGSQPPEWFNGQRKAAEARLGRNARPADGQDDAARLFPNEQRAASPASAPAGKGDEDPAAVLFKDEAKADYDQLVSGELDPYALAAFQDGEHERGEALKAATSALAADFREAGTDAQELKDAFAIVRQSAGLTPPTPEQMEASFTEGMAVIQAEGITDADLNMARRFIADLERVSPGVVASLEQHGAGNSPKLIRAAVREARRRGYR